MSKIGIFILCLSLATSSFAQDIFKALDSKDVQLCKKVISNASNLDTLNEQGYTPLILSSYRGEKEIVVQLLKKGADVNYITNQGSALHGVAFKGNVNIAELLLKFQADPNIKDRNSTTPLIYAVLFSHIELVKLLLKYGADPNIKDHAGLSALDHAKALESKELTELLSNK